MAKISDVSFFSVSYRPIAKCDTAGCTWEFQEINHSSKAKDQAKRHVLVRQDHVVVVVQETVSEYSMPESRKDAQDSDPA